DAAAADVDNDATTAAEIDPVGRRPVDQPGFFTAGDHAYPHARLRRDAGEELAAVLCLPRRTGGRGDNLIDSMGICQALELRERLEGTLHGRGGQRFAIQPPGAQADHLFLAIDDLE